jgi:branched-chain amino acid transport system substrate-binding protein
MWRAHRPTILHTTRSARRCALIPALLLTACRGNEAVAPAGPRVLRVGVVQSLTGSAGVYGQSVREGIELATRHLNAEATTSGVQVAYSVIDDGGAPAASTAAFAEFVSRKVDVLIGPTLSSLAPDGHALAQRAGIPVLGATTTAVGITDVGPFVFRIALAERVVVPGTLARVAPLLALTRAVLILDGSDAFSRSSAEAMRVGVTQQGATIVREIDVATQELATELTQLQGQPFDAFLVTPLVERSAPALRAIRAARFAQAIVGGNSFNTPDLARLAGEAAEGAYVGAAWNPGSTLPSSVAFTTAYTTAFGHAPDQFAAQGYAALLVAHDAATRVTGTHSLRDALAATRDLDTPLGSLSMSAQREAVHGPVVQQYRGGRLVVLP